MRDDDGDERHIKSSCTLAECMFRLKLGDLRSESKIDSTFGGVNAVGDRIGGDSVTAGAKSSSDFSIGFTLSISLAGDFLTRFADCGPVDEVGDFCSSAATCDGDFFLAFFSISGDNFFGVSYSNGSGSLNS